MYTDNDFIRLDWAAKNMLRDKANFEVFEGLMTVLFGEPVTIIELLESESNRESQWDPKKETRASSSATRLYIEEVFMLSHSIVFNIL